MTPDHTLVLDESPLVGRDENVAAWTGYFSSFPTYVIYPRQISADGRRVVLLGSTTGSHLGLPDEQEIELEVIWLAEVIDGALALWQIVADSPEARARAGLSTTGAASE
jgi:SnoaL-like domain